MATTKIDRITFRDIKMMDDKEVRSLYTKWRDIAHKRAARARGKGLEGEITREFPKLRDLKPDQVRGWLMELNKYVADPGTTIRGRKKREAKQLKTLHSGGSFKHINQGNLAAFGRFMERARAYAMDHRLPNSDLVASIFDEAQRLGLNEKWLMQKFQVHMASEATKHKLYAALAETRKNAAISAGEIRSRMYS